MSNASCSVKRLLPISALLGVDKREIILEILAVHHLQGLSRRDVSEPFELLRVVL